MLEQYPEKVKIVFKHFPLNSHRFAAVAALASVAASNQGKFWQYHDLLFSTSLDGDEEELIAFAEELELNLNKFKVMSL